MRPDLAISAQGKSSALWPWAVSLVKDTCKGSYWWRLIWSYGGGWRKRGWGRVGVTAGGYFWSVTPVFASKADGRWVAGGGCERGRGGGRKSYRNRPHWGLLFRVLSDPVVLQEPLQPKQSCGGLHWGLWHRLWRQSEWMLSLWHRLLPL